MDDGSGFGELERWADLRDKGVITEDEFQEKKREILEAPAAPLAAYAGPGMPTLQQQRINNAYLIELVGGCLGFLGLGYIYVGRTNDGLIRLIAWWILVGTMWTAISLLSIILIGLCLIPAALIVQLGGPIWSASELRKAMLAEA